MNFKPSPTTLAFMQSRAFIKILMGPVGGGKSTGAVMTLWTMAVTQAPHNNVRRTKYIILRNTMAQLMSTVKPLIDQWFVELPVRPLGVWRLGEKTFEIKCRLPDGTIVHTEFMMMAADTPDDVRRLLSVEASGAWVEEGREVVDAVFSGLQGRINRCPNRQSGGVTYPCVLVSTNPPPVGTFWHKLISAPPKNTEVFIQPPALLEDGSLNPEAENLDNLAPDYYPNLLEGKTEDWVKVYLKNKFGLGAFGSPVFSSTFRKDFHVAKESLVLIPSVNHKVIVGSDNGLQAAAVVGQQNALGHVNVVGQAYVPQDTTMGYDRFMELYLLPVIRRLNVPPRNVLFVVDPACFQRSQATEVTIAQIIQRAGFAVVPANTNVPERRVSAVESLLTKNIGGKAQLQIDPSLDHLINALEWGYRNKKQANGQLTATPDKTFHSHMGEAFQYFCTHFSHPVDTDMGRTRARPVEQRHFAYT